MKDRALVEGPLNDERATAVIAEDASPGAGQADPRDTRVLTDGARTVEIHHMAGNTHADGLLIVYLPKERLLIQADAFTSGRLNAPAPAITNQLTVNLADNIGRLNLSVDRLLPRPGRIVPLAELYRMIGRAN